MKANPGCIRAIVLMLAALAPELQAQQLSIAFDREKTQIAFVLTDVLHTVRGNFQLKEGQISFDAATNRIAGEVVIDAASGRSGNSSRDKRMTRDILEAQRFPEIRFAPETYTGVVARSGASGVQVSGSFLIHGGAHRITIPMQIQMSGRDATATGKFVIPYVEWGMKNPSNFLLKVNDKVEIDVNAAGHINGAGEQ